MAPNAALVAYYAREDLHTYGKSNGLILYGLELQFGVEDSASVAAVAVTDHSNDKKADFVYYDTDRQTVVIAQGYFSEKERPSAPANKASDLNTAVSWIMSGALDGLPELLQSAALEVRQALERGDVRQFHLWYCHNLPESVNVQDEVTQAAATTVQLLNTNYPDSGVELIYGLEVGQQSFQGWYERLQAPILITDSIELPVVGGFEMSGETWRAYCTSVPGSWLRDLWLEHKHNLLSPNVRDYLGSVRSERNINNGIKKSAEQAPADFWAFNNGLTILTNNFTVDNREDGARIAIEGVGIVNGAQTTGALGTLSNEEASEIENLSVLVRFVQSSDVDMLSDIIRFNNTQNKVEASDFRSNDPVQDRLRAEFGQIPNAEYRGARRGGTTAAIERRRDLLPDRTVAQALAAFHGSPNIAYNETRRIWEDDNIYSTYFSDVTSARHIVFCYSLVRSIEDIKQELLDVPEADRTSSQEQQLRYLRRRGSIQLLSAAIASSMETILAKKVHDLWSLRFVENVSPASALASWRPVLLACLAFASHLEQAADTNLRSAERTREVTETFGSMILATAEGNKGIFGSFAKQVQ